MYTHLISTACGKTSDPEQEGVSPTARTDDLGARREMEGVKRGTEGVELGAREGGLEYGFSVRGRRQAKIDWHQRARAYVIVISTLIL